MYEAGGKLCNSRGGSATGFPVLPSDFFKLGMGASHLYRLAPVCTLTKQKSRVGIIGNDYCNQI